MSTDSRTAAGPTGRGPGGISPVHTYFVLWLAGICLLGLIARGVILTDYLRTNALANAPIVDANVYWEWAGEIAQGKLLGDMPFFSAPLYPYLLGLLRALGGGLTTVYVCQILADVAAAALIAWAARSRFGAGTGLLAAVLFFLLRDPAALSLRVLSSSLHVLLVAALYFQLVRVPQRPTGRQLIGIGVTLGLFCLSYPPAILLAVAVGIWLLWRSGRTGGDVVRAAVPVILAALVVAPATLHNYLASHEFIPISAQGGITFAQGNAPGALGLYTEVSGVSRYRDLQNLDALKVYQNETGRPASWGAASRFFMQRGLEYWREDPRRALTLILRKVYLFLSFRNYGDIYVPNAEVAYGLNPWLRLAGLPVPWLIGPALVGLVLAWRRVRPVPEWLLLLLPLLVVAAFWYSPRYRLPVVPVVVVLAAFSIVQALQWREHLPRTIFVALALAAGIVLAPINRAIAFDLTNPTLVPDQLASAYQRTDNPVGTLAAQEAIVRQRPNDVSARIALGDMLEDLGRDPEAWPHFEAAYAVAPDDPRLPGRVANAYMRQQRYPEADLVLTTALKREPSNIVLLKMLARVREALGRLEDAADLYDRVLKQTPGKTDLREKRGILLIGLKKYEEARDELTRAVQEQPDSFEGNYNLGLAQLQLKAWDAADAALTKALDLRSDRVEVWYALGYLRRCEGRYGEALSYYQQGLAFDPNNFLCQQGIEEAQKFIVSPPHEWGAPQPQRDEQVGPPQQP